MMIIVVSALAQWLFFANIGLFFVMDKLILFYWLIYRPDRVWIFGLTLLYIFPDIKEGWYLGFSTLTTLLFIWAVLLQRHVLLSQTFMFQWFACGVILCLYFLLVFLSCSFMATHALPILPLLVSYAFAILLYPVIFSLMMKIQNHIPMFFELED